MKPSDHPGFKDLLKDWNQKLAETGFRDIEETRHGELTLKKSGTEGRFRSMDTQLVQARAKYYEIIGQRIVETQFDSDQEKRICALYFEGYNQAEIRRQLGEVGKKGLLHRETIFKYLTKYLKRWGLK